MKRLGIAIGLGLAIILGLTLITTILSYFDIIGFKFVNVIKIIIPIIALFVSGFILGKKSNKKGWFEGIKLGSIFVLFFILISLLTKSDFKIANFIYYLIVLSSCTLGSMFGISKKKDTNR